MRRLIAVAAVAATVTTLVVLTAGSADRPQKAPTAKQVVGYINHQRVVHGLPRLTSSGRLSAMSQRWSKSLAASSSGLAHDSITTGRRWSWIAETLYRGPGGPVRPWMASPSHRQILLAPQARLVGVGRTGDVWVARFARR